MAARAENAGEENTMKNIYWKRVNVEEIPFKDIGDIIDESSNIEDALENKILVENLINNFNENQLKLFIFLLLGFKIREIYKLMGYKNVQGLYSLKNKMFKIFTEIKKIEE